jgi:histidinol-phosphate aminotransferase
MAPYRSARDEFEDFEAQKIFLDANENPYNTEVNRYPDPLQRRLKRVLAKVKGVSADQILLGNGSDEVLDLVFRTFCEPGQGRSDFITTYLWYVWGVGPTEQHQSS